VISNDQAGTQSAVQKGYKYMRGYVKYIKRAKELGAKQAKVISAKTIVAAEWVRLIMQVRL